MDNEFDILGLNHYQEGNEFTGSKTKSRRKAQLIRYLIRPDRENHKLQAFCWTTDLCYAKAPDKQEHQAPLTEDGLQDIRNWLCEKFREL